MARQPARICVEAGKLFRNSPTRNGEHGSRRGAGKVSGVAQEEVGRGGGSHLQLSSAFRDTGSQWDRNDLSSIRLLGTERRILLSRVCDVLDRAVDFYFLREA